MRKQFEEMLEECQVGYAVLPNGDEIIVKGKAVLEKIIRQNLPRIAKVARVDVHDEAEADELRQRYDNTP